MKYVSAFYLLSFLFTFSASAQSDINKKNVPAPAETRRSTHYLTRPGEITFTEAAVIEGKIEKPQVMIVFPKEKAKMDSIVFDHSFNNEMTSPLNINVLEHLKNQ